MSSRRIKEDTDQILCQIQGTSGPNEKPHSKIDIGIIFGYENIYMKQHLRSQDVCQKYGQTTANAKIQAGNGELSLLLPDFHLISNLPKSMDRKYV